MIILVTGGSGMIGKNLQNITNHEKYTWIYLSSKDGDLRNIINVESIFKKYKPNYVIHLAANVGGLYKNMREKTAMFRDNVRMNENILEICNKYNIQKAIFCLSSCMYPINPSKFPMNEDMIHESYPHKTNEGYAYAKRMLEMQCRNYNTEFGRQYICLIPVNLYGFYDNFHLEDSHVVPGLIHKIYLSKQHRSKFIIYGTGKPLRQFLYAEDFAKIIIKVMFDYNYTKPIIICNACEVSITELANIICNKFDYSNDIEYDVSKSDGCIKKTMSNQYFLQLFPNFKFTELECGISKTINWFVKNYEICRK